MKFCVLLVLVFAFSFSSGRTYIEEIEYSGYGPYQGSGDDDDQGSGDDKYQGSGEGAYEGSGDGTRQDSEEDESPTYKPCESPFREIAYKMCILSVEDRRLSWTKAEAYCQSQGSALAQEASVIKVKRFLNDLYGEDGSRVRWPFWVGARMVGEGEEKSWQWYDGTGILSFLWSQSQPRPYTPEQTPEGACMILDGYQAYYTASLPCHLKRRFVCQRN